MSFNIWRITDGKAGHDSQSLGLCKAIGKRFDTACFDVPVASCKNNLLNILLKRFPAGDELPDPWLIIGAGRQTHLPMLAAKRARKGKTIVLMKPGLPLLLFDYCLIPQHDSPPNKTNIVTTFGAINTVEPDEKKNLNHTLILIGGPSKHFQWQNKEVIEQIRRITSIDPNTRYTVVGSPRTPEDLYIKLRELNTENVQVLSCEQCDNKKLNILISSSGNIWVTEDSVSMIYESLSSGANVGLIEITSKRENKIHRSVKSLINEELITPFNIWNKTQKLKAGKIFNEAERCTHILAEMGAFD